MRRADFVRYIILTHTIKRLEIQLDRPPMELRSGDVNSRRARYGLGQHLSNQESNGLTRQMKENVALSLD